MTLMYKIKWTCIYFTVSLCLAMLVGGAYLKYQDNQDYCVINRPWVSVSGHIASPGLFERYLVSYRGTTKVSGEDCTEAIWVTKYEYEWVMYGREN